MGSNQLQNWSVYESALALLVARVSTDYAYYSTTFNDLTVAAHFLNWCTYFHFLNPATL